MTEKKPDSKQELTNDVLIADVMLRITAIEKLLIEKGVFTQDELTATTEEIAKRVAKVVLEKAQASKSVDEFIANLEANGKKNGGPPSN
jgi:TPP-dependent pyruvate/acetoin dehydrogenase alpha subunit